MNTNCKRVYFSTLLSFLLFCNTAYSYAASSANWQVLNLSFKAESTIKIPQKALVTRNGIPGVFVRLNGEARFRMIRLGKKSKKSIHILAGLFGNEAIITNNVSSLYDGMSLNMPTNVYGNINDQ